MKLSKCKSITRISILTVEISNVYILTNNTLLCGEREREKKLERMLYIYKKQ